MATITDNTYFEKGSLFIPNNKNINSEPEGSPSAQSELDFFIEKYERELLLNALGVTLYDELQAELPTPTTQKWIDLIDGLNYTINGETKRWDGLKGFSKQSVIAFYIFCEYLRNDNTTYTTVGTVQSESSNAINVNATPKYIKSWMQFIEFYQGKQINGYPTVVTNRRGAVGLDWYGGNKGVQVSLYQYLTDANVLDETAFPDFEFRFYTPQNSFGL